MKLHSSSAHLAYCTNIHPAETWLETFAALKNHTLRVRDLLETTEPYAIGLRLSARAANELLEDGLLAEFKNWLDRENCYVFTINGFPYGAFHGTRVKEKVYQPDWTSEERLDYTLKLFEIVASLVPEGVDGSVSTLPGSFKEFQASEAKMFANLDSCALGIEELAQKYNRDLHLGMEPEPLGHFENTQETLAFFERMIEKSNHPDLLRRRIGINYDTCHFALEFDDCQASLDAFRSAGLRISKVHLSSALEFQPALADACAAISQFNEPTYLHQVIVREGENLTRYRDLPDFLTQNETSAHDGSARCHFHIPLYADPAPPLKSTADHAEAALSYLQAHPDFCTHFEIETYTWGVLPDELQIPIEQQIAREYQWVIASSKI